MLTAASQSKLACAEPVLAQLDSFLSLIFLLFVEGIHTTSAGWTEGGVAKKWQEYEAEKFRDDVKIYRKC